MSSTQSVPIISFQPQFQSEQTIAQYNSQELFNKAYGNYINYYYPNYAAYYNYNNQYQQFPNMYKTNFYNNDILHRNLQPHEEQKNKIILARKIPNSISTTPPSAVYFYFFF